MNRIHTNIFAKGLIFATLGIFLELSSDGNFFEEATRFILATVLLLVYLVGEIFRVKRMESDRWIINPAVLCSFFTFIMAFGITNIIYFLPQETLNQIGLYATVTPYMNKMMILVLLGAIAMWSAYWSPIAAKLASGVWHWLNTSTLIKKSIVPKKGVLSACLLINFASRMFQIKLGIYGYSSDIDLLYGAASYTQYLSILDKLSTVSLVIASLQYFSYHKKNNQNRIILIFILIYEVFFGFLSGFKSQVVMPFLVIAICQYWCVKKIPWKIIAFIPVAIFISYSVIEPFRNHRYGNINFNSRSLNAIVDGLYDSTLGGNSRFSRDNSLITLSFLGRMNMTYVASLGVEFADKRHLPASSPKFLEDILYSPLHAFIPRVLWQTKSIGNQGSWYTRVVLGQEDNTITSSAMSPFTYLYFAGGEVAVIFGFFLVGILHRIFNAFVTSRVTGGGALVLILILPTIVFIDSVFSTLLVNLFRMLPILIIFQYFIIRKHN